MPPIKSHDENPSATDNIIRERQMPMEPSSETKDFNFYDFKQSKIDLLPEIK